MTERYADGSVKIERQVTKDAAGNYVNHGTYTAYAPDGTVQKTGVFQNGKQQGKWTQSFAKDEGHLFAADHETEFQGPFASEATFVDGQLDGTWTIKDRNGQNIVEWNFDHGARNGKWSWWYPNGDKRLEATYKNGNLDGEVLEWNQGGQMSSKTTYVDGKRLDKVVGWYTLGQKHFEGNYLRVVHMPEPSYDWWKGSINHHRGRRAGWRRSETRHLDRMVPQRQQEDRSPIRSQRRHGQVRLVVRERPEASRSGIPDGSATAAPSSPGIRTA